MQNSFNLNEFLQDLSLSMQISPEGVTSRDEKVFRFAREKKIPLIMLTSGLINLKLILQVFCFAKMNPGIANSQWTH